MNKIWYIWIDGNAEGPLSFDDLKNNHRITPDTLAWKVGYKKWKKIREFKELKDLFKEKPKPPQNEESLQDLEKKTSEGELILDMRQDPPYFLWILLIVLACVILKLYLK